MFSNEYNYVWQKELGYNPLWAEENFEYMADNIGALFNGSPSGNATLLNLDVHGDDESAVPDISFQETNTSADVIYMSGTYDYTMHGPKLPDDIILCDMVGTYTPTSGVTVTIPAYDSSYVGTAGPYFAGFYGNTGMPQHDHCLTGNRTDHHQPLNFSGPNGYTWGIEQDGLMPVLQNTTTVPGIYAQGLANLHALELSWGTNSNAQGSNGSLCATPIVVQNGDGCSAMAVSQTATCGYGPDGMTPIVCSDAMALMLDSGLYKYGLPPPYTQTNFTGQLYVLFPVDACNPYLWLGIAQENQKITGLAVLAGDLGFASPPLTYNNCAGHPGTFTTAGAWVPQ